MSNNQKNGKATTKPKKKSKPETTETPLYSPEFISRQETWHKLEVMWNEGKLDRYRGQSIIYAADTIFAHGRNLLEAVEKAEKKAKAKGVNPDLLVWFFVPAW